MDLNKYAKYIKKPDVILHYSKKFAFLKIGLMRYKLRKKFKYDSHKALIKKISSQMGCRNSEELIVNIKRNTQPFFLSEDFNVVISEISKNKCIMDLIIDQANHVLNNSFYILYKQIDNMYDAERKCYKWDIDYITGYKYRKTHYSESRKRNVHRGSDIKRVWEIARMQYLFAPALAYRLTGEEKYALKVKDVILDFIKNNPVGEGVDWNISMEVGIRLANILLLFELILPSPCLDAAFTEEIIASAIEHRDHILKNEENTTRKTSNHYLGGLLGLAACSVFFINYPGNSKVFNYVYDSIQNEIKKQILDDGGDYEGSSSYQRLVGELIGFTVLLCERKGQKISSSCYIRLKAMAQFTIDITAPDNLVPQLGDNDCGRVFQLLPEQNGDHRFYVNLLFWITSRQIVYSGNGNGIECFIGVQNKSIMAIQYPPFIIKAKAKIVVVRYKALFLLVTANESQDHGMGGHTHNDLLSFVLYVDGEPIVVDPGSGTYTADPTIRNTLRSTHSHATVKVHGEEQRISNNAELFNWRSKCSPEIKLSESDSNFIIECSHDGYLARYDCFHKRLFYISKTENILKLTDLISGGTQNINADAHMFFMPLYKLDSFCIDESKVYILNIGKRKIQIYSSTDISLIDGLYSDFYDNTVKTKTLRGIFSGNLNTVTIRWM